MRTELLDKYYASDEYKRRLVARMEVMQQCENDFHTARLILEKWSVDPIAFIEDFLWVKLPNYGNAIKPFFLFEYQKKIIRKLQEAEQDMQEHTILIDKPREMGITYIVLAYFYWRWLFTPDWSGFLLSRSEDEVDKGESTPDGSLFGKIRYMISNTPKFVIPESFTPKGKKGTDTDRQMFMSNPAMRSSLVGSSTNSNAGRSRRYSMSFMDECFFIENFQQIIRSMESVCRVKVLVSSAQPGRQFEKFKDMVAARGDYISLTWKDHPFKDDIWFERLSKKAEEMDDPEIMREAVVSYAVDPKSRYYPNVTEARTAKVEYDPKRPLYLSMDTGRSDFTVLMWMQYDGRQFNVLECFAYKNRDIDWYAPFINPDLQYNPVAYQIPRHRAVLDRVRKWKKPAFLFSGLDIKAKKMPTNRSTEQHLYPLIGMKCTVNNYAEGHEARRTALSTLLPLMVFNEDSEGAMMLLDAISNSQYASASKATSKRSTLQPIHGTDGTSDYRSAAEYMATNVTRAIRMQRNESRTGQMNDVVHTLHKYLRV